MNGRDKVHSNVNPIGFRYFGVCTKPMAHKKEDRAWNARLLGSDKDGARDTTNLQTEEWNVADRVQARLTMMIMPLPLDGILRRAKPTARATALGTELAPAEEHWVSSLKTRFADPWRPVCCESATPMSYLDVLRCPWGLCSLLHVKEMHRVVSRLILLLS